MKRSYLILIAILLVLVGIVLLTKRGYSGYQPLSPNLTSNLATANQTQPTPTASSSASNKLVTLRLFLIALKDNGANGEAVGCNDTIAPVNVQIPDTKTPLPVIINQLLAIKQQTVGPSKLYNSLSNSNLQLKDASIQNGVATVHLTGTVNLAPSCDAPRFQAQLEKTAGQFSDVSSVQIFINDKPLTSTTTSY